LWPDTYREYNMKKLSEDEIKKYHPLRLPSVLVDRLTKWRRFLTFDKNTNYTYELLIEDIFKIEPKKSINDFYKQKDDKEKWEKEQETLRKQRGLVVPKKPKIEYKCINLPLTMIEQLRNKREALADESGRNTTWEEMFLYYIDKYLSYHADLADYDSSSNYVRVKR